MIVERIAPGTCRTKDHRTEEERAHHVGVVIGQGVSAWVAQDVRNGKVTALHWAPDADALRSMDLPKHPRSVTYVSLPEWSTLVPEGALGHGTSEDHLALVHGRLPGTDVREEPLHTIGAQCLYLAEPTNEHSILDRYPFARSLPLQAVLVNGARSRVRNSPVLLLHRGADRMDVAIADRNGLLLSSSYPARTAEDVLYFCLMATERTGLRPEHVALRTGGTHLRKAERELLSTYFADHASAIPNTVLGPLPGDLEADQWLAAFDQIACVS